MRTSYSPPGTESSILSLRAAECGGTVMTEQGIPGWMRQELKRRDWTAADLARRSGIGTGRISEWMSGHRRPSPASCNVLADAFGVDPDVVLAVAGYRTP